MTSQISVSKRNQKPHKYLFQKKSKTSKESFSRKKSKGIYIHVQHTCFFPKSKDLKHRFFKLPSFDCYETGGSFQLCVYSIFCQTSHKTSLKFLLFSKKSQPQIICFEEKQLKTTIEKVFLSLQTFYKREEVFLESHYLILDFKGKPTTIGIVLP